MNIRKSFMRNTVALTLAFVMMLGVSVSAKENETGAKEKAPELTVLSDSSVENESFIISAEETGAFSLTDKRTGTVWYSNPADRNEQTNIKGIAKMQMNSQLLVEYLVSKKDTKSATSFASATNKKGVKVSADKQGIRIEYKFVSEGFTIPILLSLDGKGLVASVLCDEITENEKNQITKISLLPFFGAAGVNDNGYFLVPDGSGALINFNNGKSTSSYQQEIYDTDGLMNIQTNKTTTQIARLPVFGIERGGDTLFAIIDKGATVCRMFSYVSGAGNNYNYIYPQFTYRQSSIVNMLSKTWYPVEVAFVSPLTAEEDFTVKYHPLEEKYGGYSDMAADYREYLDLSKKTKADNVPLYLDVYGSARVSENILGIPITVNRALTSFEDTQEILDGLIKEGIGDIKTRILGISSAGLENIKVPTAFKPASSMGGKKGLNSLFQYTDKNGIEVYPDFDFVNFKKPTFSLFKQGDAAKDVCKKTGVFYEFNKSNGAVDTTAEKGYVLKPEKVERAVDKFIKSYTKKTDNKNISLSAIASFIYADFGGDIHLAQDTADRFCGILEKMGKNDLSLMLQSPNAYTFDYASSVVSAPTMSSRYDIEDVSVPFYQMVLHGAVSYSTTSVNLSSDTDAVLRAIEYGSSLMYSISKADYSVICYDDYDHLYSITADNWMSDIVKNQKMVETALSDVSDKVILKHEKISDGVYSTIYEDGIQIIVNYNDDAVSVDGLTVEARNYITVKGDA